MRITQKEYIDALSAYFHYTKKIMPMGSEEYNKNVTTIQRYEAMNKKPESGEIVMAWSLTILLYILTSSLMAILVVWGANQVFDLAIAYSLKNIFIVACVFFVGKSKTKMRFLGLESRMKNDLVIEK